MLGSGSAGNATLVSSAGARVLVDAGFSYRDLSRRLAVTNVAPAAIDAVMITHAHGDHTRGARLLAGRHGVPVHSTAAVRDEWGAAVLRDLVGAAFAPLAAGAAPLRISAPAVDARIELRGKDLEQAHLCLGTRGYPQGHEDRYAAWVLNTVRAVR